jgi:hypothetical protein
VNYDDTPEGEYDFFDIFEEVSGACLNEGSQFFEKPDRQDVIEVIKEYYTDYEFEVEE